MNYLLIINSQISDTYISGRFHFFCVKFYMYDYTFSFRRLLNNIERKNIKTCIRYIISLYLCFLSKMKTLSSPMFLKILIRKFLPKEFFRSCLVSSGVYSAINNAHGQ